MEGMPATPPPHRTGRNPGFSLCPPMSHQRLLLAKPDRNPAARKLGKYNCQGLAAPSTHVHACTAELGRGRVGSRSESHRPTTCTVREGNAQARACSDTRCQGVCVQNAHVCVSVGLLRGMYASGEFQGFVQMWDRSEHPGVCV